MENQITLFKQGNTQEIRTPNIQQEVCVKVISNQVSNQVIDKEFVMRDDLRDWIFKEDSVGRYRERIIVEIEKIGIENWFKAKGYPIDENSIWKNLYTGSETTLKEYLTQYSVKKELKDAGYYLWESYLPKEIWTGKFLFDKYKTKKDIQDNLLEKREITNESDKEEKIEIIEKAKDKLRDVCWAIKGYFENFLNPPKYKQNSKEYHLGKLRKFGVEVNDLNKLKELYDTNARAYKKLYMEVHFMRWGTSGEEYADV